jgi:uncharacterized protein (TIGR03790 family)
MLLPKTRLEPHDITVVFNRNDPLSIRIALYYQTQRHIPMANIIGVGFEPGQDTLDESVFKTLYADIVARMPAATQAFALAWTLPYRAGCMSITSAFATGYDPRYCPEKRCSPTAQSPFYASDSHAPFHDHGIRPAMLLAGKDFKQVKTLIDRGVAADDSFPRGTGYLLSTSDTNRNVRAIHFPQAVRLLHNLFDVKIIRANTLRNRRDVMFYFTGLTWVTGLTGNRFLPGAIADHLTSTGGRLDKDKQMSALRWLEAGATGSYGTVDEPCNFLRKFPAPAIVMERYLQGETLLEAYWKSVAWPGEGVFIGEPLACPYCGHWLTRTPDTVSLRTQALAPGNYQLSAITPPHGGFAQAWVITIKSRGMQTFSFPGLTHPYYILERIRTENPNRPCTGGQPCLQSPKPPFLNPPGKVQ